MGLWPSPGGGGAGGTAGCHTGSGPGELLLEEVGAAHEQLRGSTWWETVYSPEGMELWSPQSEAMVDSGSALVQHDCVCSNLCVCV